MRAKQKVLFLLLHLQRVLYLLFLLKHTPTVKMPKFFGWYKFGTVLTSFIITMPMIFLINYSEKFCLVF